MTSGWPLDLIQTRSCRDCGRSLDESHYSMWRSKGDGRDLFGAEAATPTCNACMVASSESSRIPSFMSKDAEWKENAACSNVDEELFFPRSREKLQEAAWRPLCGACPVREACGEFGRQTRSVGVWGGEWLGEFTGLSENGPGAKLLLAGECKNHHSIDSLDDVVIIKNAKGSMGLAGACKKCRMKRSADWKRGKGHDLYAQEWARQRALTPQERARNKAEKLAASRNAAKLRKSIAGVARKRKVVVGSLQKLLDAGVCSNGHPIASEKDLYINVNPTAPGGYGAKCRRCQLDRVNEKRRAAKNG
jgi:hypothetical protein